MLTILGEDIRDSIGHEELTGLQLSLRAHIDGRAGWLRVSVCGFDEHDASGRLRRTRRLDPQRLASICDAMRRQLQSGVRLTKIAAQVGMSPSQLSRSFHATTGVTFTAFLTRLRIDVAMRLMIESDYPLCDIAVASGFGDQSHFSRSFMRVVGVTPFRWRASNRAAAA